MRQPNVDEHRTIEKRLRGILDALQPRDPGGGSSSTDRAKFGLGITVAGSRTIRICSSNVPPNLATNTVSRTGKQTLSGVEDDPDDRKWKMRCKVMGRQLKAVNAAVVLHQELAATKLTDLLDAADCGLTAVNEEWCCPISYDQSVVVPVYADRLMISSEPGLFLKPGECNCLYGQWVTACSCYRDNEWRAGGATFAAFRFVNSQPLHVDFVCVSLHLTHREPAVRARGAAEMLRPLVKLLRERFDAPVIVGGDFNMTKLQGANKADKSAHLDDFNMEYLQQRGWLRGAYGHLVGDHVANRKSGGMHVVEDHGSNYSDDEDDDGPVCADTWELARAIMPVGSRTEANECKVSTCHNWRGLHWGYQKRQALTEGVGSNSIDVFDDDGFYSHTATNLQGHLGNK